jgi:hypothetical protein
MDARLLRLLAVLAAAFLSLGAGYRTRNFIVDAPTAAGAREFCEAAERCRRELAIEWLGAELPDWPEPCPIHIEVGPQLGAGGATSFMFDRGRPHGWTMNIQGSRERLIDSVIPHEVTHTIFATHFGRPLPRWADEGACTTVEADVEKNKHKKLLITFLTTGQGIAFNRMFAMTQYPANILPLYSQGYSVARYLIAQGGKQKYVKYVGEGMRTGNWPETTRKHYGFANLSDLQVTWLEWVRQGSPPLDQAPQLAGAHYRQAAADRLAAAQEIDLAAGAEPLAGASTPVQPIAFQQPVGAKTGGSLIPVAPVGGLAALPTDSGGKTAASTGEGGSWYSRQRDLAARGIVSAEEPVAASELPVAPPAETPSERLAVAPSGTALYRPGSIGRDTVVHQTLARQQPIGRPGQTVIDPGAGYSASGAAPLQRY